MHVLNSTQYTLNAYNFYLSFSDESERVGYLQITCYLPHISHDVL